MRRDIRTPIQRLSADWLARRWPRAEAKIYKTPTARQNWRKFKSLARAAARRATARPDKLFGGGNFKLLARSGPRVVARPDNGLGRRRLSLVQFSSVRAELRSEKMKGI